MIVRSANAPRARAPVEQATERVHAAQSRRITYEIEPFDDGPSHAIERLLGLMTTTHASQTTLVLGGTGKTGRRVAQRLRALDLPSGSARGAGRPPFDWEDRAHVGARARRRRRGVRLVLPGRRCPGRRRHGRRVRPPGRCRRTCLGSCSCRAAASPRPSSRSKPCATPARRSPSCAPPGSRRTSARTTCSTHVLGGEVALPAGDIAEPFVDADDIADVAVAALTDERHVGQLYELTGPRLLTFAEAVAEIARATGRDIRYVPVSIEEHAATVPRARRSRGSRRAADLPVQRGPRRPQRARRRRRPACPGPRARRTSPTSRCDAAASGVWDVPVTSGVPR